DGLVSRSRTEYDGFPTDRSYSTNFAGKIGTRIDHSADWSSTIEFSSSMDYARDFSKTLPDVEHFKTHRYGAFASTTKEFAVGKMLHVVTAGAEVNREELNASVDYDVTSRVVGGVFGQYSFEYDALRF